MRKTLGSVVLMIVAVGLAASIASAGSGLSGPETITVVARPNQFHYVDNVPEGDSIADSFAFSGPLLRGDASVGHLDVVCTLTHKYQQGGDRHECTATATLSGGGVQAQGNIRLFPGRNTIDLAITGGTGRFQNVGGYLHAHDISNQAQRIVLHLIVP